MADDHETEQPDVSPEIPSGERTTAPQSEFSTRMVGIGLAVLVVGAVVTYGLSFFVGI